MDRFETLPAAHWREHIKANPGDPKYTLTISAPTNADAREIGKDIRVLDATDRTGEVYQQRLAIGDHHLQLADRARRRGSPSDKISGLRPYP